MPKEVIMPKVDMDMTSGKVMIWHAEEGAAIAKGDPLFDIETDKAAMEVEASDSGILHHRVPEGTDIPIGKPVAWLYTEGEDVDDPPEPFGCSFGNAPGTEALENEDVTPAEAPGTTSSQVPKDRNHNVTAEPASHSDMGPDDKKRATPRARALARATGIPVTDIAGSGPRGRIQAKDVRTATDQPFPVTPSVHFMPETGPLSITRSRGGKGTPIVMVHGFASDSTSWAALEKHLGQRLRIRIDLPGHGKSPKRPISGFAALVKEFRQAFDSLYLESAHLVGHSLGGAACLALADTRPRSVASLSLIAPAGLGPEVNGTVLTGICKATRPESLAPWLKSLVADKTIITDSYARLAMSARAEQNLRAAQCALADTLFPDSVQAFDLSAALERVSCPTRIIWGKRDAIIPWKYALRAPGRTALHLFEGVGHMPQIERPDEVGKIIGSAL